MKAIITFLITICIFYSALGNDNSFSCLENAQKSSFWRPFQAGEVSDMPEYFFKNDQMIKYWSIDEFKNYLNERTQDILNRIEKAEILWKQNIDAENEKEKLRAIGKLLKTHDEVFSGVPSFPVILDAIAIKYILSQQNGRDIIDRFVKALEAQYKYRQIYRTDAEAAKTYKSFRIFVADILDEDESKNINP